MIVYATSDLHGQLPTIPQDAELLLIAGDVCPDFRGGGSPRYGSVESASVQSTWLNHEFRAWLETAPCPVVGIWGNHDFVGEHLGLVPKLPWTLLSDSEAVVGGLRVYGTPWVPGLPRWAFYADDRALRLRSEMIPQGMDILMSHGPPYGQGDLVPWTPKYEAKYGVPPEGEHAGDRRLVDGIINAAPTVTICGHIHEARGAYDLGPTALYNVAAVDERYVLHKHPFTRLYEFA